MFYFNPFKCLLKNLDTEPLSSQAPVAIIQYLHPPITPPPLPPPIFFSPAWNDFLPSVQKQHSLRLESATGYTPPPQVGQPNRAIRQDIHHYPVGWSK